MDSGPYLLSAIRQGAAFTCAVYFPTCRGCGLPFTSRRPASYCGMGCRKERARAAAHSSAKQRHAAVRLSCKECKQEFESEYGNKRRTFCSERCGGRFARRVGHGRQRARRRGVASDGIDPILVHTRDAWHCRACMCPTPKDLRGTHSEFAPEVDHVVPWARGGSDTYDNVQTLCRACNGLKGTMTMEEFHPPIEHVQAMLGARASEGEGASES